MIKKRINIKDLLNGWGRQTVSLLIIFSFFVIPVSSVSAERLPTVNGDADSWGDCAKRIS